MATLTKSTGTVTLAGAAEKVTFPAVYGWVWVKNMSGSDIFAGLSADISEGADGVMTIPAGECGRIQTDGFKSVYLLGTGSALVAAQNYADCPFQVAKKGGDVTASGNPVTLGGLQGGVPFSDITLFGDIVGQKLTVNACGKNLIPYPYYQTTKTLNGVTFTDNGDGSITVNGTAADNTPFFMFHPDMSNIKMPAGDYLFSGMQTLTSEKPQFSTDPTLTMALYFDDSPTITIADYGNGTQVTIPDNVTKMSLYIRIPKGITVNNVVFRPLMYDINHGSTITITPDSNPYTVPNDIRQQGGYNVVSVSAGEISVTGVRKNAAVKKIWDKLDELATAIIVSNGEI